MSLESELLEQARRLGFELAGIASADPSEDFHQLQVWLDSGYAGEMEYLHNLAEARRDPRNVYPDVQSVVMVGLCYSGTGPSGGIARYARGPDYHVVVRDRLKQLGAWLMARVPESWGRSVVDTAPLLERDFARRAGLGWFGKNTMLIDKRRGSWFVLGALLVNLPLTPSRPFVADHCGTCTRCLDACPTGAFVAPHVLDARKCISYWTIEVKRPLTEAERVGIGPWVFGCDVCQEVCPWNRRVPLLESSSDWLSLDAKELLTLDAEAFRKRFRGTALHPRPGRPVVLRNAALVLGNEGDPACLGVLRRAMEDEEPMVREAAAWAVERLERTR